ncbi:hypothetical protein H5410_030060 [Solanum commersonii]|uniref:C3H1-type domain-containing protein n=1 Tax=Solanum commersonii TaxID=4109 RepID=A0A9J5YEN8_SOLCO|nr:hypothetical protein H5410_030060 [Solanum commersonii]
MCRKQSTHQIKGPNTYFGVDASRVYVKGGTRKEEQPLEVEVYNQGMFKMELCNKCKETGAHPYGEACHQFSHGIEDLLPVIRHPLYKTEVCRIVLNGDPCSSGYHCHFCHTSTDQEKVMRSLNSTTRSLSLQRSILHLANTSK